MTAELTERIRSAAREAEAIGTLGKSKPPTREMFAHVFREPDLRLRRQRQELGV